MPMRLEDGLGFFLVVVPGAESLIFSAPRESCGAPVDGVKGSFSMSI